MKVSLCLAHPIAAADKRGPHALVSPRLKQRCKLTSMPPLTEQDPASSFRRLVSGPSGTRTKHHSGQCHINHIYRESVTSVRICILRRSFFSPLSSGSRATAFPIRGKQSQAQSLPIRQCTLLSRALLSKLSEIIFVTKQENAARAHASRPLPHSSAPLPNRGIKLVC